MSIETELAYFCPERSMAVVKATIRTQDGGTFQAHAMESPSLSADPKANAYFVEYAETRAVRRALEKCLGVRIDKDKLIGDKTAAVLFKMISQAKNIKELRKVKETIMEEKAKGTIANYIDEIKKAFLEKSTALKGASL